LLSPAPSPAYAPRCDEHNSAAAHDVTTELDRKVAGDIVEAEVVVKASFKGGEFLHRAAVDGECQRRISTATETTGELINLVASPHATDA